MALEIGIRMINGEGETDSFEQSEFNYEQHNALCDDFYRTRQSESHSQQNEDAHSKVQYLIQTLKFQKRIRSAQIEPSLQPRLFIKNL